MTAQMSVRRSSGRGEEESHRRVLRREAGLPSPIPIHIRRILVPIDFSGESEKPLRYASAMARADRAEVILLHVTNPVTLKLDYGYGPVFRCGADETAVSRCRTRLRRFARRHLGEGGIGDVVIGTGKPSEEILQLAERRAVDLIILYAHPERRVDDLHSHQTVEAVSRFAPCPVLIVRRREQDFVVPPGKG